MRKFLILFVLIVFISCEKDWGTFETEHYQSITPPILPPQETVYYYASGNVVYALQVHTQQDWIKLGSTAKMFAKVFRFTLNADNSLSAEENLSSYARFTWKFQEVKWAEPPTDSRYISMAEYGGKINGKQEIIDSMSAWRADVNMPPKDVIDYQKLIELKKISIFPVEVTIDFQSTDDDFEINIKKSIDLTFFKDFTLSK